MRFPPRGMTFQSTVETISTPGQGLALPEWLPLCVRFVFRLRQQRDIGFPLSALLPELQLAFRPLYYITQKAHPRALCSMGVSREEIIAFGDCTREQRLSACRAGQ